MNATAILLSVAIILWLALFFFIINFTTAEHLLSPRGKRLRMVVLFVLVIDSVLALGAGISFFLGS